MQRVSVNKQPIYFRNATAFFVGFSNSPLERFCFLPIVSADSITLLGTTCCWQPAGWAGLAWTLYQLTLTPQSAWLESRGPQFGNSEQYLINQDLYRLVRSRMAFPPDVSNALFLIFYTSKPQRVHSGFARNELKTHNYYSNKMHTFIIKSTTYHNLYFMFYILPLHVSTRVGHLQRAQCQCLDKVIINYNY
jgi:hypothetical protein